MNILKKARKIEFTYTAVKPAYRAGMWEAFAKSEYWHHNEGIYQGRFALSPNGTYFKSLEDALTACAQYEETMADLAFEYAR